MIEKGIRGEQKVTVVESNTAAALGSGNLAVFATPAMIALMEMTAAESVLPYLSEGESTVGTELRVRHTAATPIGMEVRCESELVAVDGRKLTFRVTAFDEVGTIGEGEHERFVVQAEKFLARTYAKKQA